MIGGWTAHRPLSARRMTSLQMPIHFEEALLQKAFGADDDVVIGTKFGYDIYSPWDRKGHVERPHDWSPAFVRYALEHNAFDNDLVLLPYLTGHNQHDDTNNIAPRVGVAYRLKDGTVLRAGYGLSFNQGSYAQIARNLVAQPPFAVVDTATGTVAAALPLTTITAWELMFERMGISSSGAHAGRSLLILGGAGISGLVMLHIRGRRWSASPLSLAPWQFVVASGVVVPLALVLIFVVIFAALGSLRQVLLVYTGIPLAITGGIMSLWLRGMPFTITVCCQIGIESSNASDASQPTRGSKSRRPRSKVSHAASQSSTRFSPSRK